jgi:hypothetical protein
LLTLKDLFQTDEARRKEEQGKTFNKYAEQFKKNSDDAVRNAEANSAKEIEIQKAKIDKLATLQNKQQQDINDAAMMAGNQAGMLKSKRDDTFIANELKANKNRLSSLEAINQAAHNELIKRLDDRKKSEADAAKAKEAADKAQAKADAKKEAADRKADAAAKKREVATQKEYKDKKDAIELAQKLEEERIKQTVAPDGQAMAKKELEMASNIELLALAKEYQAKKVADAVEASKLLPAIIATQNKEIANQYKTDDEALKTQRAKDLKDLWTVLYEEEMAAVDKRQSDATTKLMESGLSDKELQTALTQNEIAFNKERIDINNSYSQLEVDAAKTGNDKLLEENAKKNRDLKKQDEDAAKERLEIFNAAVELGAQITNGFFNLYQQQLANEQTALQKKYDEEIRLADGNKQKIDDINRKRAAEEKVIKKQQFEANRAQSIAEVIFNTAPLIAGYIAGVLTGPLAVIAIAAQAAQIGFIMAQPVPEFAEGTKGKKFKGGKAMVGERGTERIVTQSGKVYYTPPTATLMDLPSGSEVIPNHLLSRQEIAYATMSRGQTQQRPNLIENKLSEIGGILKGLPIHQITMDEKGFQKFIKTESRTTKVLNNKFPQAYS